MKKLIIAISLILASFILCVPVFAVEYEEAPVSPALSVIAENSSMAKATMVNEELCFSADDFERAMNISKLTSITINKVPDAADGELKLGNVTVSDGQVISRENISRLSFVASKVSVKKSSFVFSVDNNPYSVKCDVHILSYVNYTPTLGLASDISLNVSTHRNITYFGKLSAYDPDGDDIAIEIVKYPSNGLLTLDDSASGEYRYIPSDNYVGTDSFSYVAKDCYGNYSAAETVNIGVIKEGTSVVYVDIAGSKYENAAMTMTENSIMSGTEVGQNWYFYPSSEVNRTEFLVMAMNAVGIDSVPETDKTVFWDDEYIPMSMKGYVSAAYELGYINGAKDINENLCFEPDRAVTRAEAAVILNNILEVATPTAATAFSDHAQVPVWASDALYALTSAGIMEMIDGNTISAYDPLTRADAALMLCGAMQMTDIS